MSTPKQALRAHLDAMHAGHMKVARGHGRINGVAPATDRSTLVELKRFHAETHYRYHPNHWHGPTPNRGADARPEGWKTGGWVNTMAEAQA
jgi:hypothetical protein